MSDPGPDLAAKLLEQHVKHELAALKGAKLRKFLDREVTELLRLADSVTLAQLSSVDQIMGVFHRVVVDLAPAELVARAEAVLEPAYAAELAQAGALKLITRRAVKTHNSWTHNAPEYLPRGPRRGAGGERGPATNFLYVHPDDAARLGLADGELADVCTDTGAVRVPVALLDELSVGTVALPHGWGHQAARGQRVASATAGVNVNVLVSAGPEHVDPFSGMSTLTGLVVDVRPAAGPQDVSSWTGLPETADTPQTRAAAG